MLQRQTKKRTTVCFDQCCSKINRESEVQTEQFKKLGRLPRIFSSKISKFVPQRCGDTWPGKDGRLSRERKYLCWAKSKGKPVWDSPRNTRSWQQKIGTTFYLQISVLNIFSMQYPNPKNDIVWGSQEYDVPPAFQVKQSAKRWWCGAAWRVVGSQSYTWYPRAKP